MILAPFYLARAICNRFVAKMVNGVLWFPLRGRRVFTAKYLSEYNLARKFRQRVYLLAGWWVRVPGFAGSGHAGI
jgi:hypothetical protein